MKLSEAILLGSAILKAKCGVFENSEGEGCALGMANKAVGGFSSGAHADIRIEQSWPWINFPLPLITLPCGCQGRNLMGPGGMHGSDEQTLLTSMWYLTVHLFNQHVCDGSWTIEQLADFVRSVEPAEPAPAAEPVVAEAEAVRA